MPVIVVFTKLDVLSTQVDIEVSDRDDLDDVSDEEYEGILKTQVNLRLEDLCTKPLARLTEGREYPSITVSSANILSL